MPPLLPSDRSTSGAIQPLASGPLDIIGDVHGELDALASLLAVLNYRDDGPHPDGRRLVFVGDLCDRGPDSPGVMTRVAALVRAGRAQCVLGNHELNVLRGVPKTGNGWFFAGDHDRARGRFPDCRPAADDGQRNAIVAFIASLPLALEREDLRIVHAAWHPASLTALGQGLATATVREIHDHHERASQAWAAGAPIRALADDEARRFARHLEDESFALQLLPGIGAVDEHFQMSNPVRVVTSGVERVAEKSFYASGKWRMVDRIAWWKGYRDAIPVIFGHYWRWADHAAGAAYSRGERDLFAGMPAEAWLNPERNAFCVDFSVGVRYRERAQGRRTAFTGRLAAVRWPEQQLVFDDGERRTLSA